MDAFWAKTALEQSDILQLESVIWEDDEQSIPLRAFRISQCVRMIVEESDTAMQVD